MLASHVPSSTYRIQLNQGFRFSDALRILDYLHDLGITDLYLSPVLASRKGSNHGYDVIDPTRVDPDLGSEEEFTLLQTELQNRGMRSEERRVGKECRCRWGEEDERKK